MTCRWRPGRPPEVGLVGSIDSRLTSSFTVNVTLERVGEPAELKRSCTTATWLRVHRSS
jgi:hypothetical protein